MKIIYIYDRRGLAYKGLLTTKRLRRILARIIELGRKFDRYEIRKV